MFVGMASDRTEPDFTATTCERFADLHRTGTFLIPNPCDIGTARLLEAMGFVALATTSSGYAATLGRGDMSLERDELVAHVASLAGAVSIPINVDAERCYGDTPTEVGDTVRRLAEAGASGISIEDWDPAAGQIDPIGEAADRVRAAADGAHASGVLLTARAENHLHGINDIGDTVNRLRAYVYAGADVIYAPGLKTEQDYAKVVELGVPVNALLLNGGPTVQQLTEWRVRRISTGGALTAFAQGAFVAAAQQLLDHGMYQPSSVLASKALVEAAFRKR